jgi:hypothetical protein
VVDPPFSTLFADAAWKKGRKFLPITDTILLNEGTNREIFFFRP